MGFRGKEVSARLRSRRASMGPELLRHRSVFLAEPVEFAEDA
jgi:hypothetical protein